MLIPILIAFKLNELHKEYSCGCGYEIYERKSFYRLINDGTL